MGAGVKIATLVIGVAMATTLTLSDRKTDKVIDALGRFVRGTLGTAMGTAKPI